MPNFASNYKLHSEFYFILFSMLYLLTFLGITMSPQLLFLALCSKVSPHNGRWSENFVWSGFRKSLLTILGIHFGTGWNEVLL